MASELPSSLAQYSPPPAPRSDGGDSTESSFNPHQNREQHQHQHDNNMSQGDMDPPAPFEVTDETRAAYDAAAAAAAAAAAVAVAAGESTDASTSGVPSGHHHHHRNGSHPHDTEEDHYNAQFHQNTEAITLAALAAAHASNELLNVDASGQASSSAASHNPGGFTRDNMPNVNTSVADTTLGDGSPTKVKKPRAKSQLKIKRTRKITSCLPCRDRKQKCDRVHPMCGTCQSLGIQDCTYVDNSKELRNLQAQQALEGGQQNGADQALYGPGYDAPSASLLGKRKRNIDAGGVPGLPPPPPPPHMTGLSASAKSSSSAGAAPDPTNLLSSSTSSYPHTSALNHDEATRRAELLQAASNLANNRSADWDIRVRAVRAAAVAGILFSSPHLHVPGANVVREMLEAYDAKVSAFDGIGTPVIFLPLLWPRIERVLAWWHEGMQSVPADPVLIPLLLVQLALAIQNKRTSELQIDGRRGADDVGIVAGTSPERVLVDVAERMGRALVVAAPSHWPHNDEALAPMDLVRATLLRGIWHHNEAHGTYASSCFSSAVRLAHLAGLHKQQQQQQRSAGGSSGSSAAADQEAYALSRRELWWACVGWEVMHAAARSGADSHAPIVSASIFAEGGADAEYEKDYTVATRVYERLASSSSAASRNKIKNTPPSKTTFEYQRARYQIVQALLNRRVRSELFGGVGDGKQDKAQSYFDLWRSSLPTPFTVPESTDLAALADLLHPDSERPTDLDRAYDVALKLMMQRAILLSVFAHTQIAVHRPDSDSPSAESLSTALSAAMGAIHISSRVLEVGAPVLVQVGIAELVYYATSTLAINVRADSNSPVTAAIQPVMDRGLFILQALASTTRLHGIADEADHYRRTLLELLGRAESSLFGEGNAPKSEGGGGGGGGGDWHAGAQDVDIDQPGAEDDEERRTAVAAAAAAAAAAATAAASMGDVTGAGGAGEVEDAAAAAADVRAAMGGDVSASGGAVFSRDWLLSLDAEPGSTKDVVRSPEETASIRRALSVRIAPSLSSVSVEDGLSVDSPSQMLHEGVPLMTQKSVSAAELSASINDWTQFVADWRHWAGICTELCERQ